MMLKLEREEILTRKKAEGAEDTDGIILNGSSLKPGETGLENFY